MKPPSSEVNLVWPSLELLPGYLEALGRDWSSENMRSAEAAREELGLIQADPAGFISALVDREARGGPVILPDGSSVPRLPGFHKWLWDGEFCGCISFRWQKGTTSLPESCLGHIGYTVVPWKQRLGYATRALSLILPDARAEGLDFVELTTSPENIASQRVIEANGGLLVERFVKSAAHGGTPGLRYRIALR